MHLLFVDDDPMVLQGLRRGLHSISDQWSMEFVNSAKEALDRLEQVPFDVVVTDMRMPTVDGGQLLQEVRTKYPQVLRIVLSGQSSREGLLRSVHPSHQFLSKPCSIDELKAKIAAAVALRDLIESPETKSAISSLSSIPSLPQSYDAIMREIQSKEPSMARIAAIISQDAGMSAKILQLANSALLGLRSHISNIAQAASLIGIDMVRALVVSLHIFSQFDPRRAEELQLPQLWKHSVATASVAHAIAKAEHAPQYVLDDSFSAGLLHDVGKLVLIGTAPKRYAEVLRRAATQSISMAEHEVFKCGHSEVGAYLTGVWGLPHSIVEITAWHHRPSQSPQPGFSGITAVHVANVLVNESGLFHLKLEQDLDRDYLQRIGLLDHETAWREICQQQLPNLKLEAM